MSRQRVGGEGIPPGPAQGSASPAERPARGRQQAGGTGQRGLPRRPKKVDDLFGEEAMAPAPRRTRAGGALVHGTPRGSSASAQSHQGSTARRATDRSSPGFTNVAQNLHSVFLGAEHRRLDNLYGPDSIARAEATVAQAQGQTGPAADELRQARRLLGDVDKLERAQRSLFEPPTLEGTLTPEQRRDWRGLTYVMGGEPLAPGDKLDVHNEVRARANKMMQLIANIDESGRPGYMALAADYLRHICAEQPDQDALRMGLHMLRAFVEVEEPNFPFHPPELDPAS